MGLRIFRLISFVDIIVKFTTATVGQCVPQTSMQHCNSHMMCSLHLHARFHIEKHVIQATKLTQHFGCHDNFAFVCIIVSRLMCSSSGQPYCTLYKGQLSREQRMDHQFMSNEVIKGSLSASFAFYVQTHRVICLLPIPIYIDSAMCALRIAHDNLYIHQIVFLLIQIDRNIFVLFFIRSQNKHRWRHTANWLKMFTIPRSAIMFGLFAFPQQRATV